MQNCRYIVIRYVKEKAFNYWWVKRWLVQTLNVLGRTVGSYGWAVKLGGRKVQEGGLLLEIRCGAITGTVIEST